MKVPEVERRRLLLEADLDCDQCEGTGVTMWPDSGLGKGAGKITMKAFWEGPCHCTQTWKDL